ncbi:MAG TPA: LacI family DNA-binding transcriptional regulator, partial [Marinilabiliaceae bacterium]|nr:LacI family DNA-binding transcriptional regulator [Marinilabiliaceae bacterium]
DTQARVLKIASELNYRPSFLSQVFNSGKTKTIGLVAPHLNHAYIHELVQHISVKLDPLNFRLLPAFSKGSEEEERRIVADFRERHVEAIIAIHPVNAESFKDTSGKKVPTLFIDYKAHTEISTILLDLKEGTNLLLQHHIRRHRKAIGFITIENSSTPEVAVTYKTNYLDRFGINAQYHYNATCFGDVGRALEQLQEKKINALLFASPQLALRTMRHKIEGKITLSDDIEISCVGWMPELELAQPKITGLKFNQAEIAEIITQYIFSNSIDIELKRVVPSLC